MGGEQFVFELVLLDHEFEVDVYVLAALGVEDLAFLLLTFGLLHLDSSFLSVLLYFFDFVEVASSSLVVAFHLNITG